MQKAWKRFLSSFQNSGLGTITACLKRSSTNLATRMTREGFSSIKENLLNSQSFAFVSSPATDVTFGVGGGKRSVEMLLKVDKNWEEIHINQLSAIQQSISSILGAQYHALYLASVSRGCILLKFMVPTSTMNIIFPLSSVQKKSLEDAEVMMLKCGRYKYRFSPTTGFHRSQV